MTLTELVVATTIAAGVAAGAVAVIDVPALTAKTTVAAHQASCRTIEAAVVAYIAEKDVSPRTIDDLAGWVSGNLDGYAITDGGAVLGPGCVTGSK